MTSNVALTFSVGDTRLSSGHRVIDIMNGHFIHAGPLEGIGVSIYLSGDTRPVAYN
jgi:hypothetical protein